MPQTSLIPSLDAAVPIDRVEPETEAEIRRHLRHAFPDIVLNGVPDYVVAVLSVEHNAVGGIVADVMLFDGELTTLELTGFQEVGGEPHISWHPSSNGIPFGYDQKAGVWRRYPDLIGVAEAYRDAFARLAEQEAAAEVRRERARRGAATRRRNREARILGMLNA